MDLQNSIQYLDFANVKRKHRIDLEGLNYLVVTFDLKKSGRNRAGFSNALRDICHTKGLYYFRIAVNSLTDDVFLVLTKDESKARITNEGKRRDTSQKGFLAIHNKEFVYWLSTRYKLGESFSQVIILLSEDLSNRDDIATFRLLNVKE